MKMKMPGSWSWEVRNAFGHAARPRSHISLTGVTEVVSESESESEPDETSPDPYMPADEKGDRNSQLAVGHGRKNNRTFVMRGDKIGVFKHANDGKVEYAATIRDLGFKRMKNFEPNYVSLVVDLTASRA